MKNAVLILAPVLLLAACQRQYVQNPDLNHTHADFAVWAGGQTVEFTDAKFMSGENDDGVHEYLHQYLHLHDEIGHVIHRHKPGIALDEFFDSLGYVFDAKSTWHMYVNAEEVEFDLDYVFEDMDQILLTTSVDAEEAQSQIDQFVNDACRYSRTCPWRGDPPAENCVADPAVPCVVPEEDL
jgi:hypothetical protein